MADIQRYPLVRHARGAATTYVRQLRAGRTVREGVGLSFWFRPLSAVLSEVPVDDRELPLQVRARSADFQLVTVQATVAFRILDPGTAATRLDFSIDPDTGAWRASPLEAIGGLLTELAQQQAIDLLAELPLREALAATAPLRERVHSGLDADARLRETGLAVVGVRVLAIRPEPDVERALQAPTREAVQQEADRASFERRAVAVERERAISENELQSRIELAVREERLVAQEGQNARRRAEESAAAAATEAAASAERERTLGAGRADAARLVGLAQAETEAARLAAARELDSATLLALALREAAGNLPDVGTLHLAPDLLTSLLGGIAESRAAATASG